MDVIGAKVIVALHGMSAINSFFLLLACIRRNLNGKPKNALTITCLLTSNTTFLLHLLAFISGIWVIPANEKINGRYLKPVMEGWEVYLDAAFCKGTSYLVSLYLPTSLLYMGMTLAYIPYWSIMGVLTSKDSVKIPHKTSNLLLKPAALFATLIILPALHVIVYDLTSNSNTKTILSPFYCQYDLNHISSAVYLLTVQLIAFLVITYFSGTTFYTLVKFREESIVQIGKCSIPGDAIIRAAVLGASTTFVTVICAIDQVYNMIDPSIGQYNVIPYASHALMATLGSMAYFTWGSTNELLRYNPKFLQPIMKLVQEKMSKMLPFSTNTGATGSGSENSAHSPSHLHAQSSTKDQKEHSKVDSIVISSAHVK